MAKKKKKKTSLYKNKMYVIVCILSLLTIVLLILLGFKIFAKDYYKVDSRVDKVKELGKINDVYEAAGWLRIQGTDIDLPVLYSDDFSEPFPMELESFVWTENFDKKQHNITKIVGHNLYNLSKTPRLESKNFHRFEQLMNFIYYDFAKENKYIQYTIDGKDYLYKIFAVRLINESEKYQFPLADDYEKDVLKRYIKNAKDESLYNYNVDVNENDKLISLSTCTRLKLEKENMEFYVIGRLVRDGEKINNYNVTKSDNYKKVEEKLKGDDENEDTL